VTISGEARPLRRLMRNLLENARRHSDGSPITATLHRLPKGGARLEVLDRGPGIPVIEQERVFEPFYRPRGHAAGRHGGVGLGLALVREIARHHGGDARCRTREGGGTVLEVELAAGEAPARRDDPRNR
jgi:signal transduction histidine kinase